MNVDLSLSSHGLYTCLYCGLVGRIKTIERHIWAKHRRKELNIIIVGLDTFLKNVVYRFINRYKILVESDDLLQYLRTNIYLMLNNEYKFKLGKPEYFAKASCRIFLMRFLQEYHYKRNVMHHNPQIAIPNDFQSLDERYDIGYDHHGTCDNIEPVYFGKDLIIVDNSIPDPIGNIISDELKRDLLRCLTVLETEIFNLMIDDRKKFTQKQIAKLLHITQPLVSYYIKSIRKKLSVIISQT